MTSGIYCYKDTWNNNQIVYIGKDKHIWKNRRHGQHFEKGRYNEQQINRVLQNNPERYRYEVLIQGNYSNVFLNAFERIAIWNYNPIFNFTKGGDGRSVPRNLNKLAKPFVRILKSSKTNEKPTWEIRYDDKRMGRSIDKEFLETLVQKYFDQDGFSLCNFSETQKQISKSIKKHKNEQMARTKSKKYNSTGYRNVSIMENIKKGNRYRYRYTENGVRKSIQACSINELKEKVEILKLPWEKF